MSTPLYAVDIETDTTPCHFPERPCCSTRGLDPFRTTITEIVVKGDGVSLVLDDAEGEQSLLERFRHLLAVLPIGIVVTWNGHVFDAPFLATRYKELGLTNPVQVTFDSTIPVKYAPLPHHLGGYRAAFGGHGHIDICHHFRSVAGYKGVRHSLKPVAEVVLGYTPVTVDRANMHLLSAEERHEYVVSDGTITVGLARTIPTEELLAQVDPTPAQLLAA